jgi:hypothetical protein
MEDAARHGRQKWVLGKEGEIIILWKASLILAIIASQPNLSVVVKRNSRSEQLAPDADDGDDDGYDTNPTENDPDWPNHVRIRKGTLNGSFFLCCYFTSQTI